MTSARRPVPDIADCALPPAIAAAEGFAYFG